MLAYFFHTTIARGKKVLFKTLEMAPPDPIFHLKEAFARDPNPAKIDLSVGVYQDACGNTPILGSVKRAEDMILNAETSKTYLGISGSSQYAEAVQTLLFGPGHEIIASKRAMTAHTPGGTGALRVAGDLFKQVAPQARIWVSEPTWPNHPNVFLAAGMEVKPYPYWDVVTNDVDLDRMLAAIRQIPSGDVVVLHGCCHNPTGIDPTPEQWAQIGDALTERSLLPLVDLAYQGFANGIRQDAAGVLALCKTLPEVLIASSFSKNFGLYNERVGALTIVTGSQENAQTTLSHVQRCIRANYSNPPAHGASIVTTVLNDPQLRAGWEAEVKEMRDRINQMRSLFADCLAAKGVRRDFSFVKRQRGMFTMTGLTPEQVDQLRIVHSIYMVRSGRINVAGMTESNVEAICQAIADVLAAADGA
jgi:aspartate/tyrosine/aromatic aminotransferase